MAQQGGDAPITIAAVGLASSMMSAAASPLPSRCDADAPMSRAAFNRVTTALYEQAQKDGTPLEAFTVHDLRRTGSTLLNELGFNTQSL
jgi:integrase